MTQIPATRSTPLVAKASATAANAPGASMSSALSQVMISPLARAKPLLMASLWPLSFSLAAKAMRPW
jgi:hypothetical protein